MQCCFCISQMPHYFSNVVDTCVCVCERETAIVWCTAEKELRARVVFCVNGQMTHAGREDHISDSKGN